MRMTFSDIVDAVVDESKRGDKIKSIIRWTNEIIQRVHSRNDFDRDQWEVRALNRAPDGVLVWPRPRGFRKMKTAFVNSDRERSPDFTSPNKKMGRIDWDYYYYADESYVFCGDGICHVDIMYYRKPPLFQYYPTGKAPARWRCDTLTSEGFWEYLTPNGAEYALGLGGPEKEHWARYMVADWLTEEYGSIFVWGVLNLLATATEQEELRRSSYAAFTSGIEDIKRDNSCSSTDD